MKEILVECVCLIPYWFVASYTTISKLYNLKTWDAINWRLVWRILSWVPEKERQNFPWWRVLWQDWEIKAIKLWKKWAIQIQLLQKENVLVDTNCFVDMKVFERKP